LRSSSIQLAILAALLALSSGRAAADDHGTVRVNFVSALVDSTIREFFVEESKVTRVGDLDFELGISLEGAEIEFLSEGTIRSDVELHIQYETSVTIMDDGPHLDLLDWKHHSTEWIELTTNEDGRFVLPMFGSEQLSEFPEVTPEELRSAVHAAGGERWSSLMKEKGGVHEFPAAIGISALRLKFVNTSAAPAIRYYVIEFPVPMGC